jgi:dTDP-4-dehydrorhamnose reductase
MSLRTILATGGSGQLGIELANATLPAGWQVIVLDRARIDLEDTAAIAAVVAAGYEGAPWAAVINGAAYTAVDKAEQDVLTAWKVNALAPAAFGAACAGSGIPLVQVSTDYVFAGDQPTPWEIDDPVAPLGVYGASKLGGELAVRTSGARHAIVRTAWVVSPHGQNFVKTMLRVGAERDVLRVVGDQRGSPTNAADLGQTLLTIQRHRAARSISATPAPRVGRNLRPRSSDSPPSGVAPPRPSSRLPRRSIPPRHVARATLC